MSTLKDTLHVVEGIALEKGVEPSIIFEALEKALAAATQKLYEKDIDVEVKIKADSGDYETFRRWLVVPDDSEYLEFEPDKHIGITEAQKKEPQIQLGYYIRETIPSVEFGRIAAQNARQVLLQKVREAELQKIVRSYKERVGQLLSGTVKRVTRDFIFIDLGANAEGVISRQELIPREVFRAGDRIRAYLKDVRMDSKTNKIVLSRTHPQMLAELFRIEVPEVGEGIIQVMGAARDPGIRAKIAVHTNDGRLDPIGACIGIRGSRVQAVSSELCGERVDIILWDSNPIQYVINSLAPAEVVSVTMDEETHTMDLAIPDEQLSQAIGKNGQNVRLASELTGWNLNVMGEKEAAQKMEAETDKLVQLFAQQLDVDDEIAAILAREGFTTVEEVAYVPIPELLAIEEFDEDIVKALRDRAKETLLAQEQTDKSEDIVTQAAEDLAGLAEMTPDILQQLVVHHILTRDDLAEQSVDELVDILEIDREKAAALIMEARQHWFNS